MSVDLVLLQPESPGNVGSVARVMKNFSFYSLVLVDPCEINDETRGFAKHAWDIVKNARVVKKMDWDSYELVVGTTGLKGKKRPFITPEDLGRRIGKGKIAIVFGRESKGLSNQELERCDCICRIPTSHNYPVMNLSHSVSIVLYELSKASHGGGDKTAQMETADREQLSTLRNLFKVVIKKIDYAEKKRKMAYACLKNVTGRSVLSKKEAKTLIGVFKKIKDNLKS